ncbi:hypothetical protein RZS08_54675, partial [Arthrospira platensis SPKY1]|nr:hypothetical protein [Arthrospira platensis SPKY1]
HTRRDDRLGGQQQVALVSAQGLEPLVRVQGGAELPAQGGQALGQALGFGGFGGVALGHQALHVGGGERFHGRRGGLDAEVDGRIAGAERFGQGPAGGGELLGQGLE